MKYLKLALEHENRGELPRAISQYEKSIVHDEKSVSAYANLAFIYWLIANDYGFARNKNIDPLLVEQAATRWEEILRQGLNRYPENTELVFWQRYFMHIMGQKLLSVSEYLVMLEKEDASLIPYFFVEVESKQRIDPIRRNRLCAALMQNNTVMNEYIRSMIGPCRDAK